MDYNDLKDLIRHLKGNVTCPVCGKHFMDKDVAIIATMETEAVFQLTCSKCDQLMVVNVSMANNLDGVNAITVNDVIDMHNFLEQFNGDFKNLFKFSK